MNKELTFRAWDLEKECWISRANLAICGNGWPVWVFGFSSEPYTDKVLIERCTGFKDVYGKEIFVGDIVSYNTVKKTYIGVIEWSEESQLPIWKHAEISFHMWNMDKDEMSIIGDIHHQVL